MSLLRRAGGLAAFLILFPGCRKHDMAIPETEPETRTTPVKAGLPPKTDSVHGYFYADVGTTRFNNIARPFVKEMYYAVFSEPPSSLLSTISRHQAQISFNAVKFGNIAPGEVFAQGDSLERVTPLEFNIFFQHEQDSLLSDTLQHGMFRWQITGNKSFLPAVYDFEQPFVALSDSISAMRFKLGSDLTIGVDTVFSAFDSASVTFLKPGNLFTINMTEAKRIAHGEKQILLHREEIEALYYQAGWITHIKFAAFRYFHKWENGKLYVFEFGRSRTIPLTVTP